MKKLSYSYIRERMKATDSDPFKMSMVGDDREAIIRAVNQGIDSHLEACFTPDHGDSFVDSGTRLECCVSAESLPVLMRRLLELDYSDIEEAETLVVTILDVLHEDIPHTYFDTGCVDICPDDEMEETLNAQETEEAQRD